MIKQLQEDIKFIDDLIKELNTIEWSIDQIYTPKVLLVFEIMELLNLEKYDKIQQLVPLVDGMQLEGVVTDCIFDNVYIKLNVIGAEIICKYKIGYEHSLNPGDIVRVKIEVQFTSTDISIRIAYLNHDNNLPCISIVA